MKPLNKLFLSTAILVTLASCNKKEKVVTPTVDNEALTTVLIIVANTQLPFDQDTATLEQLLDNNGNPLSLDTSKAHLVIKANTTYNAKIVLLDKTQNPAVDITNEVRDRANYHLFFYQPLPSTAAFTIPASPTDSLPLPIPSEADTRAPVTSNPLNLTVNITDHDTNVPAYPVGLQSDFVTGAASAGWLRLVLRHQPNVKNGTYAPGSTDLDVGFTVKIQ